ncbi:aquaporin-like protein [Artomyces pyxidatus]|uniref:Aquaporin-like protein n=1 Tax=Artomyces pyxidatus TaxID=48021 RepID=A0ACB8TC41_9AGAM|nr:aquaporin-like protein [Artomyces pyxidatus]
MHQSEPHQTFHLADIQTRPRLLRSWERVRHRQAHWAIECLAEMFGVFFYCYAGLGAQAAYILGNIVNLQGLGSLLTIGLAYAMGVVLATVVTSGTSGGHLNPAVTLYWVIFKRMPIAKGARYIVAQILGGYLTCLVVYLQWKTVIKEAEGALVAAGSYDVLQFTANGPAGIFANFAASGTGLGLVWINEFMSDFFIGLVIRATMDPTNFMAPPAAGPWIVGFTYAVAVCSYAPLGLAANAARDVGGRLAAITIWGLKASGGRYAAISAITNIPATLLACAVYEFVFTDSSRVITSSQKEYIIGHRAHMEHKESGLRGTSIIDLEEKGTDET